MQTPKQAAIQKHTDLFSSAAFYGPYDKMWSFIVAQWTWRAWFISAALQ